MPNLQGFHLDSVPDHHRDRVGALIPHPALADAYKHRTIDGMNDFDLFDIAIEERENIILAGDTGSSKTSVFRAYAAARRLPFALVECHAAMDPGLIVGRTSIAHMDGLAVDEWIDGDMTLVARYGGVILLDEVNMAIPRVLAAFKALISVTRAMTIPENNEYVRCAHPVLLGAAYNPRYQGTSRLNEAFLNQFAMPLDWNYDPEVERQLIKSERLLEVANQTRSLAEIRTPVSTNALMEFERHVKLVGWQVAQRFFVNRFAPEERGPVARALDAVAPVVLNELNGVVEGAEAVIA